jgi:hypothetical protein
LRHRGASKGGGMIPVILAAFVIGCAALAWRMLRVRGIDHCLLPYLLQSRRRRAIKANEPVHVLLCIADHFEPRWGNVSAEIAMQRVQHWVEQYPRSFSRFRDSDGRPPRHTFFFPIDQYDADHVDALAELCRQGFGEVEIHLHHDHDTADNLRQTLLHYTTLFSEHHGLLSRVRNSKQIAYGFIHGNWALDNARRDGSWCGVNNELQVLRETGCFADFTLPSVPSPTQTRKINSIYYAQGNANRCKSHNWGIDVGTAPAPDHSLMLIQGPLLVDWQRHRIENACLQASQPPSMHRLDLWIRAGISVPSRPDWRFVKLHTHGAPEANQRTLLGQPMLAFHANLAEHSQDNPNFHFHYVTAREMYNLVRAAENGYQGDIAGARDYELLPITLAKTISAAA